MTLLFLALFIFASLQLVPAMPNMKQQAKARLGKAYGPVFGIASLLAFIFLIWSFRHADRTELYTPPEWGRIANYFLTLFAFLCFSIAVFRGSLRNILKVPIAIGVGLLAIGHLLANGDSGTIVLMVGFVLIAAITAATKWQTLQTQSEVRNGHDLISLLFGVAFYSIAAQLHSAVIGVPVFELMKQ